MADDAKGARARWSWQAIVAVALGVGIALTLGTAGILKLADVPKRDFMGLLWVTVGLMAGYLGLGVAHLVGHLRRSGGTPRRLLRVMRAWGERRGLAIDWARTGLPAATRIGAHTVTLEPGRVVVSARLPEGVGRDRGSPLAGLTLAAAVRLTPEARAAASQILGELEADPAARAIELSPERVVVGLVEHARLEDLERVVVATERAIGRLEALPWREGTVAALAARIVTDPSVDGDERVVVLERLRSTALEAARDAAIAVQDDADLRVALAAARVLGNFRRALGLEAALQASGGGMSLVAPEARGGVSIVEEDEVSSG